MGLGGVGRTSLERSIVDSKGINCERGGLYNGPLMVSCGADSDNGAGDGSESLSGRTPIEE